jgi:hypothetical protein
MWEWTGDIPPHILDPGTEKRKVDSFDSMTPFIIFDFTDLELLLWANK